MELCTIVQRAVTKTIPKKKKCKKAKWLSAETLQIAEERREVKSKGERKRYIYLNAEFQRIAWRYRKAFLNEQCKEIEEIKQQKRLEISSRKLEISGEPSIFPSIRVFSNESALHIRWPKYWSFSFNISPSSECLGLISFRMDWSDLLAVQGTLKKLLQHHSSKHQFFGHQLSLQSNSHIHT